MNKHNVHIKILLLSIFAGGLVLFAVRSVTESIPNQADALDSTSQVSSAQNASVAPKYLAFPDQSAAVANAIPSNLAEFASSWNQNDPTFDFNRDGVVNSLDYVLYTRTWKQ